MFVEERLSKRWTAFFIGEQTYMSFTELFILSLGLSMDAFAVSITNGMCSRSVSVKKSFFVAFTFGFFQFLMPLIGWICVHTILQVFIEFEKIIPWIALILLCYIGGSLLKEGFSKEEKVEEQTIGIKGLLIQGIATSIDALSVGFTIAHYNFTNAFINYTHSCFTSTYSSSKTRTT